MDENASNDSNVEIGDVFEDRDMRRPIRRLKVVDIEDGCVRVVNLTTERMTRIRLDRLKSRLKGSHGYARIVEAKFAPKTSTPSPETSAPSSELVE